MKKLRALLSALLLTALLSVTGIVTSIGVGHAGSGLNQKPWGNAGYTVSSTSPYKYSNMSGFAQAVINSQGETCSVAVDGIFGNTTTWWLAVAQNFWLGYNNGGSMSPSMWNALYGVTFYTDANGLAHPGGPNDPPRLNATGNYDGLGTAYYEFYGSGNIAYLGWNPFSPQWMFAQSPNNPNALIPATPSRTISGTC